MAKDVFVIGAGGHGRVVLDALLSSGVAVAGVLDPQLKRGESVFGVTVRGGDEFLDRVATETVVLVNGLGANPSVVGRKGLFDSWKARSFSFERVRHPSAVVGRECQLGEGSQVMAGAVLQNRIRIGVNAVINTRASVDHDCVIGDHSFVAPGAVLSGDVSVGGSVFIGAGAVLLPGIAIGAGAVVGAGAIVTRDVPDGWVVVGNPATRTGIGG